MVLSKLSNTKRSFYTLSSSSSSSSKTLSLLTLLKSGFTPTIKHFNQFLIFLFQNHKFKSTIHLFSQMNSNQLKGNSHTHSIFTRALINNHNFEEAMLFMKTHMVKSSVSHKNKILDSLIQEICNFEKDPEKGFVILRDFLRLDGVLPSSFTFCSLIHGFSCLGNMGRAIEVLEMMSDEKIGYPFDNYVCSKVICGFVKIGKPELAVGFYENATKTAAVRPNVVTYTALLSAYCRLGKFEEVKDLVFRIENDGLGLDVVFYSCWINECFGEGNVGEAFRKHREMVERKIELDTISYTILIDGFSKDGNVEKAVGFLKNMKRDGLKPNLVTYTAIILGFCKKGKLDEAFMVLKVVEDLGIKADEFTNAILIDGVCRSGDFDRAFNLLDEMAKKGIRPSVVMYNTVINGLCKVGRTSEADEVSKGTLGDNFTYSTLLHGYIEEENSVGMLETKRKLEESGVCMDVVMCNTLIKALFMVGLFEDALAIYKGMPEMDLAANSFTYCTMIDGYCKSSRIDEALEIFDEFRRTLISSVECYNCILCGLCKNGMVNMAIEVFMELNERGLALDKGMRTMLLKAISTEKGVEGVIDFVCRIETAGPEIFDIFCNHAICYLCKLGFSDAACEMYMLIWRKELVLSSRSYYSILSVLIRDGKMPLIQPILNTFVKNYGFVEPRVSKIFIRYLTKNGRCLDAYKLIMGADNKLPHLDVVDYTIMVDSLCKGGYIDKALDLCSFAKKKGIKLSVVTYNSVINGLCQQGCFVEAFRLFDSLEKIEVGPSEITYATLIDALTKEGYLVDARRLFERMILKGLKPNTRVYNSLINGYCRTGQLEEGLKLLLDLEVKCLVPDEFTVSAVINGCCRNGDMEGALGFFLDFKRKQVLPDFLGFLYLIRGLCSKGRMEESRSVLREMLQTESIVNLLNRVDTGVENESMERFLVFLCEQGSIKEAITVLGEVGSMFFTVGKSLISTNEKDLDLKTFNEEKLEKLVKHSGNADKSSMVNDFNSYYALIASLCSRGELLKANKLAKELSGVNRGG